MTDAETKLRQRRAGIAARNAVSAQDRQTYDARICAQIVRTAAFESARRILSYRHCNGEPDVDALAIAALAADKVLAFPYCLCGGRMLARIPHDEDAFVRSKFGILEPDPARSDICAPQELDLIVLPCTAFDAHCCRVGMGAGYYDRFLADCPQAVRVVVAYESQRVNAVPAQPHDLPGDLVITEHARYTRRRCGKR